MTERPLRKEPSKAFNRKKEEPKVVKIHLELALCTTVVFLIGKRGITLLVHEALSY
jgi:hypothetical protein